MSVTTARQKVLNYLAKNRAVSAIQIGRALKMSSATVRHHLSVLVSDGRVEKIGVTQKEGRGRPVKLYGISEKMFGNNLANICDVILTEWLGQISPSKQEAALRSMSKRMMEAGGLIDASIPIAKRLALVVEKLNEMKYQARWEAGAGGPRIQFGHCPYAAIIERHPELCQMDATLLNTYINEPARQIAKIEQGGSLVCTFVFER